MSGQLLRAKESLHDRASPPFLAHGWVKTATSNPREGLWRYAAARLTSKGKVCCSVQEILLIRHHHPPLSASHTRLSTRLQQSATLVRSSHCRRQFPLQPAAAGLNCRALLQQRPLSVS